MEYFYDIFPIQNERIINIFEISKSVNVEIMVHPEINIQYNFLLSENFMDMISKVKLISYECI